MNRISNDFVHLKSHFCGCGFVFHVRVAFALWFKSSFFVCSHNGFETPRGERIERPPEEGTHSCESEGCFQEDF